MCGDGGWSDGELVCTSQSAWLYDGKSCKQRPHAEKDENRGHNTRNSYTWNVSMVTSDKYCLYREIILNRKKYIMST